MKYAVRRIDWLAADGPGTEYTITGLDFEPQAMVVRWCGRQAANDDAGSAVDLQKGVGLSCAEGSTCVAGFSQDNAGSAVCGSIAHPTNIACTVDGAGNITGSLSRTSFNSDGVTFEVVDSAPQDITLLVEMWGDGITVADMLGYSEPGSTGNVDYSVPGFDDNADGDQVVFFATASSSASFGTAQAQSSSLSFGVATGPSNQFVVCGSSDDGSDPTDTDRYCSSNHCSAQIARAGGNPDALGSFVQFQTDGFRVNWTARAVSNRRGFAMALKGGKWQAGTFTIDADTVSAVGGASGLPFTPIGVCLATIEEPEPDDGVSITVDVMGFGAGESTSQRMAMGWLDQNGVTTTNIHTMLEFDAVLCTPNNTGAAQVVYDLNSLSSDAFQIIVDATGGGEGTNMIGYVTFGNPPSEGEVFIKQFDDGMAVDDERANGSVRGKHFSDGMAVGDERASGSVRGSLFIDSISVTDERLHGRQRSRHMFDSAQLSDQVALTRYIYKLMSDFASLIDDFSKLVGVGDIVHTISIDDAIVITDSMVLMRQHNRLLPDSIELSDGTVLTREFIRLMNDSMRLTDQQLRTLLYGLIATDDIELGDGVLTMRIRIKEMLDWVALIDDFAAVVSGAIQPLTLEVRARIGVHQPVRIGYDRGAQLGADSSVKLGGYN